MKAPKMISYAALFLVLATSGWSFELIGPWRPIDTNATAPAAEQAYLAGYRDGYSVGYHNYGDWVGPLAAQATGPFAEAYARGQQRGCRDGMIDADAERARIDAERDRTRKRPWHPPLLPDADESRGEGSDLLPDFLQFGFTDGSLAADTNVTPRAQDANPPEFPASQVLRAVSLTNIVQPEFVAWTPQFEEVVILGRSGTNYVTVVVRHSAEFPDRWQLPVVQIKWVERCQWIRGQLYYDHSPTHQETVDLIRLLLPDRSAAFKFKTEIRATSRITNAGCRQLRDRVSIDNRASWARHA